MTSGPMPSDWLEALRVDLARLAVPKSTVLEIRCSGSGHPLFFLVGAGKALVPVSIEQRGGTTGLRVTMDQDGNMHPAHLGELAEEVSLPIGPCACGHFEPVSVQYVREQLATWRGNGKLVKVLVSPLR